VKRRRKEGKGGEEVCVSSNEVGVCVALYILSKAAVTRPADKSLRLQLVKAYFKPRE